MDNAIIFMFIFSGAILFYALLLAWTKDIRLIRRSYAAKINNKKAYAVQFAKVLALTSFAPFLAALAGFLTSNSLFLLITLVGSFIICIKIGVKVKMVDGK